MRTLVRLPHVRARAPVRMRNSPKRNGLLTRMRAPVHVQA